MIDIPDVSDVDIVFSTKALSILPPYDKIPAAFKPVSYCSMDGVRSYYCRDKDGNKVEPATKWLNVVSDWFFKGLKDAKWTPKEGVDTAKALRAVKACIGDWSPSHEHKEAGCAFLLSEWFEDVTYTAAK